MAFTFKNLLIVERNSTHPIAQFVREKGEWFPELVQPFEYTSPYDKIIICYANALTHSPNVELLGSQNTAYEGQVDGVMKMHCDGNNLRVFYFRFTSADLFRKHIEQIREYFLAVIRSLPQNGVKYTIYWKKGLLKDEAEHIVHSVGLLGNRDRRSHTFTEQEIRSNIYVTAAPSPALSSFPIPGTTPVFNFSAPAPYPPFPPVSNMMSLG